MNQKHKLLLQKLSHQQEWLPASHLAEYLSVSERSIKNYIKLINETYDNIILSSRNGYKLNGDIPADLLGEENTPQSIEERINYILRKLLIDGNDVDLYDICDELFISDNTLKADLIKVRRRLRNHDLTLQTKNDRLSITGPERNRRKLICDILYDESNEAFVSMKKIQSLFPHFDTMRIEEIVKKSIHKHHYYINNYFLPNLVIHIMIALNCISHKAYVDHSDRINIEHTTEYQIAEDITKQLELDFQISFNANEIYELSLLLLTNLTSIAADNKKNTNYIIDNIEPEYIELVDALIQDIKNFYYLEFNDANFRIRFALHLKNMINRAKNHIKSRNPLADNIKNECPFIYDCAVHIVHYIIQFYHIKLEISDDEIAYIAFHIGNELEIQRIQSNIIHAVIYYPGYYDLSNQLFDVLNKFAPNDLVIDYVISNEKQLEESSCDLLITIVPIDTLKNTICISPFFSEVDRKHLSAKINDIHKEKKLGFLKSCLPSIFNENLFERNERITNKSDVIYHICNRLYQLGYVEQSFEYEILERENLSTTAFHDIAIPHSIKMNAIHTGMYIIISQKGIEWDHHIVHIVVLLAIDKEERKIFQYIYDILIAILTNPSSKKLLLQAENYQAFLEILFQHY